MLLLLLHCRLRRQEAALGLGGGAGGGRGGGSGGGAGVGLGVGVPLLDHVNALHNLAPVEKVCRKGMVTVTIGFTNYVVLQDSRVLETVLVDPLPAGAGHHERLGLVVEVPEADPRVHPRGQDQVVLRRKDRLQGSDCLLRLREATKKLMKCPVAGMSKVYSSSL